MQSLDAPRRIDPSGSAIRPTHMAHFVLHSTRMSEMVEWYKRLLNAHEVFRNDELSFLTFDAEHHRIAIRQRSELKAPDRQTWGVTHIAYSFASLGDLLATFMRLQREGVLPHRAINHGPTTSLYYHDPDGTNIELQTDNFDAVEDAYAFMASDEFKRNPKGIPIDPQRLIRDYERGVPERVLKTRPLAPRAEAPQ